MNGQEIAMRWMIRSDMDRVICLENNSFDFPWTEDEFIACLRCRNSIGVVAELSGLIVGYMIYELHKTRLHILNFCVDPDYRRQGVGTAMVTKLASKLSLQRRTRIALEVSETNLTAQLFFRANGFRAERILFGRYDSSPDQSYYMVKRYRECVTG